MSADPEFLITVYRVIYGHNVTDNQLGPYINRLRLVVWRSCHEDHSHYHFCSCYRRLLSGINNLGSSQVASRAVAGQTAGAEATRSRNVFGSA
jgi:hypothetical protein